MGLYENLQENSPLPNEMVDGIERYGFGKEWISAR